MVGPVLLEVTAFRPLLEMIGFVHGNQVTGGFRFVVLSSK